MRENFIKKEGCLNTDGKEAVEGKVEDSWQKGEEGPKWAGENMFQSTACSQPSDKGHLIHSTNSKEKGNEPHKLGNVVAVCADSYPKQLHFLCEGEGKVIH